MVRYTYTAWGDNRLAKKSENQIGAQAGGQTAGDRVRRAYNTAGVTDGVAFGVALPSLSPAARRPYNMVPRSFAARSIQAASFARHAPAAS
jgi:hypothetical protein